jgi:hypothetical protein
MNRFGIVAIVLSVLTIAYCAGKDDEETPRAAFLATQQRIENRDYESEWNYMTDHLRNTWIKGINNLKAAVRGDPGNREAHDKFLQQQYELSAAEFLKADPRFLHARFLEVNRRDIVRYEVLEDARIEGKTATLKVRLLKDDRPTEFRYVLVDGRWLLDEGMKGRGP